MPLQNWNDGDTRRVAPPRDAAAPICGDEDTFGAPRGAVRAVGRPHGGGERLRQPRRRAGR